MTKVKHVQIAVNPNTKAEPLTIGVIGSMTMDNSAPTYIPKFSDKVKKCIENIRFASDTDSTKSNNSLK